MATASIELLLADLSLHTHAELERDLLPRLHVSEQARYRQFTHPQRRHVWLSGRALLLAALTKYLVDVDVHMLRTDAKGGVRYGDDALHLSLSHCRELLVVALAQNPVGVDIEWPQPRGLLQHAEELFSVAEARYLSGVSGTAHQDAFYALWTLKEAACKAAGAPLMQTLHDTYFDIAGGQATLSGSDPAADWCFMSARIKPGWHIALAVRDTDAIPTVACWRLGGTQQWQRETLNSPRYLRSVKS